MVYTIFFIKNREECRTLEGEKKKETQKEKKDRPPTQVWGEGKACFVIFLRAASSALTKVGREKTKPTKKKKSFPKRWIIGQLHFNCPLVFFFNIRKQGTKAKFINITRALRFELRNKSLELFILPLNYTLNNHCMILFKCIFFLFLTILDHLYANLLKI